MKKITTLLKYASQMKFNVLTIWLAASLLVISGCSQGDKEENVTVSISLPRSTMEQLHSNLTPASIEGDLTGIASVIISVYDNNNGANSVENRLIGSGDILAAGGTLKFTVLPYTALYISGQAYDNGDPAQLLLYGETTVNGLKPGSSVGVAFPLQSLAQKPVTGVITTAGSVGTIAPGTVVQVIEVVNGTETVIGEGEVTNASGAYTLSVPNALIPASNIIFRVLVGDNGSTVPMDARYTSDNLNINPVTHAASQLVSRLVNQAETTLDVVTVQEIIEMERTLNLIALDLGPQPGLTFQEYADYITATLESDLETSYIASSAVASGQICGTVTDSNGTGLGGITMIVRNFHNELLRAKTETAANGGYCVSVPLEGAIVPLNGGTSDGQYIIGAINRTENSFAASQWWTATGGVALRIDAGKIIVNTDNSNATADFTLPEGTRITGTVTAASTTDPVPGINVMVRDKISQYLLVGDVTDVDGTYALNVPVGEYIVEARNNTSRPYATESYVSEGVGTAIRNFASILTPQLNTPLTANFSLPDGNLLTGVVTENQVPVTGVRMYIDDTNGGAVTRDLISKRDGSYQVWLRPGTYDVYGYGQRVDAVDLTQDPSLTQPAQSIVFTNAVATLPVVVQHDGQPASGVKLRLWEYNEGPVFKYIDFSKSDGSATLYSDSNFNHLVDALVEGQKNISSIIYQGQMQLGSGQTVQLIPGETAPGITVTLQNAGWLTGSIADGASPVANTVVTVFPSGPQGSYSRLVFTRTNVNGQFELSVPQGTYGAVRVGGVDCLDVPVSLGSATELTIVNGQCQGLPQPIVSPTIGAIDVAVDTGFSADVSALGQAITALQNVSLTLTDNNSVVIPTVYTPPESGFVLIFSLSDATLNAGTPYTANLQIGYTDAAGNPQTYDYAWTFTTLPIPLVSPAVDSADIVINSTFTADLSPLSGNIVSLDNASLSLTGGPSPISTDVQMPTSGPVVEFLLLQGEVLRPGTTYTATLSLQYTDTDSNARTYEYSWSFTTSDLINLDAILDADLRGCVDVYVQENGWLLAAEVTDLYCGNYGIQDITGLQQFINIGSLDLSDNNISNVSALRDLTNLVYLNFGYCGECSSANDISDLTPLSGLINLQELILDSNRITDASALAGLINLQILDLSWNQLENLDWAQNLSQLTTLYVSYNDTLTDISGLQNLAQLNSLYAYSSAISDISVLNSLTGLITANLYGNAIGAVNLAGMQNLTNIDLGYNRISSVVIGEMPQLQTLRLNSNKISSISLANSLSNLRFLDLSYSNLTDISFLTNLSTLTTLYLNSNNIGDLAVFSNNANLASSLTTLDLGYNNISDVSPISSLTGLLYVYISVNNIINGVDSLAALNNALAINLYSNTRMSCDMVQSLDIALDDGDGGTLGRVRWDQCFIDRSVTSLVFTDPQLASCVSNTQLPNVSEITTLDCSSSNITNLTGIDQLPFLENLNLSNNTITDFTGLSNLRNLSVLNLTNANVDDLYYVSSLKNLNTLILDSNPFAFIYDYMGRLTNLINLSLVSNQIVSGVINLATLTNTQSIDLSCSPTALESEITALDNAIDQGDGPNVGVVRWSCTLG